MTKIGAPQTRSIFDNSHDVYLQPNEFASNKNFDTPSPIELQQPVRRFHAAIPATPAYPAALVADPRLAARLKDRSMLLQTDPRMQRLWLEEARRRADVKYVANWHHEVRMDREEFELAWITNEVIRREHFFQAVDKILRTREKVIVKARRLQQFLFSEIRRHSLRHHIKMKESTLHAIKAAFERHARFLAWRLDNLYLPSDTHGIVRVKHGGHHVEAVAGALRWQLREIVTQQHHAWRYDHLFAETASQGLIHVKHGGQSLEHVLGNLRWQRRDVATKHHHDWRHDHNFMTLPNGGFAQIHHQPGQPLEHIFSKVQVPKTEYQRRLTRTWHTSAREVQQPNGGIIHAEGLGELPERAAALLWRPKPYERQKEFREDQGSHQLLKLPNGGFVHSNRGHVRGQSPELLTAEINKPKREKVVHGHDDFHKSHLMGPTPNHGIAPLKGHGLSFEHVSARAADRPKQSATAAFKLWRDTHTFATNANHQMLPVKIHGRSYEKVSGEASSYTKDLITKRFLKNRLDHLYTRTGNGGWRKLGHTGKSLETVTADVAPPDEGTGAKPVLAAKGGHELVAAKTVEEGERKRVARRDMSLIQKSLAAHEQTVSFFQGHVVHSEPKTGAVNAGTLPAIAANGPKKLDRS